MSSPGPGVTPQIPDYDLNRIVGRGAYGEVWLARSRTGVDRAVKVVWRHRFTEAEPYEREFNGLCAYAQLSSKEPHHLWLLHVGRNDPHGYFYAVMELADDVESGREIDPDRYSPLTLKQYLDPTRRLSINDLVAKAVAVTRGLASLHAHGLVHRDIKPSNIVVIDGRPKLADIGLVSSTCRDGTFVGTEGFVPPEGPGTPQADVYSLGKVLYELATGRDRHDYPQLPGDLQHRADRRELLELNEIIIRACDPRPAQRYADADALLHELLLLRGGKSLRRVRRMERALSRARRGLLVVTAVLVLATSGVIYERHRAQTELAARLEAEAERDLVLQHSLYRVTVAQARDALARGEYDRARTLLHSLVPQAGESDLRDPEWRALLNDAEQLAAPRATAAAPAIASVHESPNGDRIAVGTSDGRVTVYDAATLEPQHAIDGILRNAGFSPDGRLLLGVDREQRVAAWSTASGALHETAAQPGIHRPLGIHRQLPRLAYLQEGSTDEPHRLLVHDFETGTLVAEWPVARREPDRAWEFFHGGVDGELKTALLVLHCRDSHPARWRWQMVDLHTGAVVHSTETTDCLAPVRLGKDRSQYALLRAASDLLVLGDPVVPRAAGGTLSAFDSDRTSAGHSAASPSPLAPGVITP